MKIFDMFKKFKSGKMCGYSKTLTDSQVLAAVCAVVFAGGKMCGYSKTLTDDEAIKLSTVELKEYAATGDVVAMFYLGRFYEYGEGVAQDKAEAAEWYRKAAEQGFEPAKNALRAL